MRSLMIREDVPLSELRRLTKAAETTGESRKFAIRRSAHKSEVRSTPRRRP